jgi:hypothetical protein
MRRLWGTKERDCKVLLRRKEMLIFWASRKKIKVLLVGFKIGD